MSDECEMSRLEMIEADLSLSTREAKQIAMERIAALEATVARLTAPVTDSEVVDMVGTYFAMRRGREAGRTALTAFLERRMRG